MPNPIPPLGDPDFQISSPTNGVTVGPNFSVTGSGPKNMQNLAAQVGTTTMPGAQETDSFCWEAVFVNMVGGGPYSVQASYANGVVPLSGTTLTITIDGDPGVAVAQPTAPAMMATAGGVDNPWNGWQVHGTYDPAKISEIQLFLTQRGRTVDAILGVKAEKLARINALAKTWTCTLDFVPAAYRGEGFLIHYRAKLLHGGTYIYGTCISPFTGPK